MPLASLSARNFNGVAVDQTDVLEIDGDGAAFLPERGTKDVQVFPCNPPTYAQDHQIFFNQKRSILQVIASPAT